MVGRPVAANYEIIDGQITAHIFVSGYLEIAESKKSFRSEIANLFFRIRTTSYNHL